MVRLRTRTTDRIEDVYRSNHERLWRSLFGFSGSADIASEAEAEAFCQLIRRGDEVRDPQAWVWTAAFRIAKGQLMSSTEVPSGASFELVKAPHHDDHVIDLLGQLDRLSEQQRAVVVLRYVGNLKPSQIAETLGTSSGSVRVQLHRSHELLRESMKGGNK